MKVILLIFVPFVMVSCGNFGNGALDEKLIQFSDEVKTVGESDRIQVRLMYFDAEGRMKDSLVRFVGKEYFEWNPWMSERFLKLKKGERYQWQLTDDWADPEVPIEWKVSTLDLEILDVWKLNEWLSAMTWMAQSGMYPEDSVIQWVGTNWIGDQPWEVKKPGLLWRWIKKNEGSSLDTSQQITTHITTHHLNGEVINAGVDISAFMKSQHQWIPAIQWVIPYLHEGDSVEIVSHSKWTFQQNELLGIPNGTPLKFRMGVHTTPLLQ